MLENIDLDHIQNTNWYRQGGSGVPLFFYIPFQAGMRSWGVNNAIIEEIGTMHHGFINSHSEYLVAKSDIEKQKND